MINILKNLRIKLLIKIYRCIPIKKNKIILWSNSFKDYGCNPKYIAEYLSQNYDSNKFDIVYVINNDMEVPNNISQNIKIVRYFSKQYLYELLTSKIIITNHRIPSYYYFEKRKKQVYIQTWHSSMRLKKIEKDAISDLSEDYVKFAKEDSKKCDFIISGSKFSTNIFKNSFWYKGKILEFGTPRSDILFSNEDDITNKVKEYYKIPKNKKIVLYAPTFRKNKSTDVYNLDYMNLISKLELKYESEWVLLLRLHPNLSDVDFNIYEDNLIFNASKYNDMQELLVASDILITDYSSCMFDFGLIKKPCFLYTPDLDNYLESERSLYFDIRDLPFSYSITNESLMREIENFNNEGYYSKCDRFLDSVGSFEDGKSTSRICDYIYDICYK